MGLSTRSSRSSRDCVELRPPAVIPPEPTSDEVFLLRREDLAALRAAYLRDSRAPQQWALVFVGFGGLALGPILITVAEYAGWPERLAPYFFFSGWAVLLSCLAILRRRNRRIRDRYQFRCPECDAAILNSGADRADLARVELVIATARCPECGAGILAS